MVGMMCAFSSLCKWVRHRLIHQKVLLLREKKKDTNSLMRSTCCSSNPSLRTGCCSLMMGLAVAASANAAPIRGWKNIVAVDQYQDLDLFFVESRSKFELALADVNEVCQWGGVFLARVLSPLKLPCRSTH